jgi:hypothetical protein
VALIALTALGTLTLAVPRQAGAATPQPNMYVVDSSASYMTGLCPGAMPDTNGISLVSGMSVPVAEYTFAAMWMQAHPGQGCPSGASIPHATFNFGFPLSVLTLTRQDLRGLLYTAFFAGAAAELVTMCAMTGWFALACEPAIAVGAAVFNAWIGAVVTHPTYIAALCGPGQWLCYALNTPGAQWDKFCDAGAGCWLVPLYISGVTVTWADFLGIPIAMDRDDYAGPPF